VLKPLELVGECGHVPPQSGALAADLRQLPLIGAHREAPILDLRSYEEGSRLQLGLERRHPGMSHRQNQMRLMSNSQYSPISKPLPYLLGDPLLSCNDGLELLHDLEASADLLLKLARGQYIKGDHADQEQASTTK